MDPPLQDRLTIGLSFFCQYSFFSNGIATTTWSLATALERLGHSVCFINTNPATQWFEDCVELKSRFPLRSFAEWKTSDSPKLNLFIDIDGFVIPEERTRIAEKVVVFIRKPSFIFETEKTVYPVQGPVRNLRDCDAIWTWAEFGDQDAHILELLSEKPVLQIPYRWSEEPVAVYGASLKSWNETAESIRTADWECHIAESNASVSSSATLPLVIAAYAKTHAPSVHFRDVHIHNTDVVGKHDFFKDNVWNHCKRPDLNITADGRQRITDWRNGPKTFILSHTRFQTVKPTILDAVWNGIPCIHNSPLVRDFGFGLERLYYADNSVLGATEAMKNMALDFETRSGIFADGALQSIRTAIQKRFDISRVRSLWNTAIGKTLSSTKGTLKTTLRIGFSDLWDDANPEYNFWTLLLNEAGKTLDPPLTVQGVRITESNVGEPIDGLVFGPFGSVWKSVPSSVPKIHTTGENTSSILHPDVCLNFGFDSTDLTKGIYRFPLWIQYLDWFGADQDRLVNPRTMPVGSVVSASKEVLDAKDKFCAFIVSNPMNELRNNAFHWLNTYKPVDSAGRLFNNVGDAIFTQTGGGGGGELKKFEFLKQYRFCLTFENSRRNGYSTEKLLAAKAAGCVPIYWGSETVLEDFAEGSFINANGITSADELIRLVQEVEEDPVRWRRMAETPVLQIEDIQRKLSDVARLILTRLLGADRASKIPTLLGGAHPEQKATKAEAIAFPAPSNLRVLKDAVVEYATGPTDVGKANGKILLCTSATQKFLQSLKWWLASAEAHEKVISNVSIRVYLGADIGAFYTNLLRSEHPTVEFRMLPTDTVKVDGFVDLWEPQHFAWKLWIYQELVRERSLTGTLIWYMDAGSMIVRWPTEWLTKAATDGLCMLEDSEQKNKWWCHEEFCRQMNVSSSEKEAQQVVGGIMAFVGGAPMAWKVFVEAWSLGQRREIIVGPKWAGIGADGHPIGHRHDQSILSLLRIRLNVGTYPLERVYNHESLRRTKKSGACLYVHRGEIKEHVPFANQIGEVHLISLARRADRIKRFKQNHGDWTKQVCLRPAFDGRCISLTPRLAQLFGINDFGWKKPVMGCALSHLSLWIELAQEPQACENYLILEDDVKFREDWQQIWEIASNDIPEDYDVLYLGGVLPPNRAGYESSVEPVNSMWGRVKENSFFGQNPPTRYFHFCNYSYILSRRGAQKILEEIQRRGGYSTSADHMVCNRVADMKHYVLMPLVAGCYQDEDPKYQTSAFNDFSRVDGFDSDLWNNNDRFTKEELDACFAKIQPGTAFSLTDALQDAVPATTLEVQNAWKAAPTTSDAPLAPVVATPNEHSFYTVGEHHYNGTALLEHTWLTELFGERINSVQHLEENHEPLDTCPTFVCMKPHWTMYRSVFQRYQQQNKPFRVLHLSDEFLSDPIEWVEYSTCQKVFRFYAHPSLVFHPKVFTLPLGYNKPITGNVDSSMERPLTWSFYGTNWKNRAELLTPLTIVQPMECVFYSDWMDPTQLKADEYSAVLWKSKSVACPKGQNAETFRFWEALEHGCVPLYVRSEGDDAHWTFLSSHLPLLEWSSYLKAGEWLQSTLQNQDSSEFEAYRNAILHAWATWKEDLKKAVRGQ
jgi:GR25 family glycosyltransferase involved in LPS biosynthesis